MRMMTMMMIGIDREHNMKICFLVYNVQCNIHGAIYSAAYPTHTIFIAYNYPAVLVQIRLCLLYYHCYSS